MGIFSWLMGRRQADRELLSTLLEAQSAREATQQKRDELENKLALRKLELEIENVERISEEKRKDAADRERLKLQRRQWAATARQKIAEKRTAMGSTNGASAFRGGVPGCVVCADPSSPALTAVEIQWHSKGHPGAMAR